MIAVAADRAAWADADAADWAEEFAEPEGRAVPPALAPAHATARTDVKSR